MACVWSIGQIFNIQVPATIKVVVNGKLPDQVQAKDLILYLIGKLTAEGANFKVIEFHGESIRKMNTSGRLVICNMTVEAGATSGIVVPDEETVRYLRDEAGVTDDLDIGHPDRTRKMTVSSRSMPSTLIPQICLSPATRRQCEADRRR